MKSTLKVSKEEKENKIEQKGQVIWFTGLPSSGKTTLSIAFERYLFERGKIANILDGDELRHGLNSDLGFSEEDRFENIRRVAEVAKILKNSGIIVLVSTISPLEYLRDLAKTIIGEDDFSLVYANASLAECEKRDVKGLYKKARNKEIVGFTGVDSNFETPFAYDLLLNTEKVSVDSCVSSLSKLIR